VKWKFQPLWPVVDTRNAKPATRVSKKSSCARAALAELQNLSVRTRRTNDQLSENRFPFAYLEGTYARARVQEHASCRDPMRVERPVA
jgi:hypothetical protein